MLAIDTSTAAAVGLALPGRDGMVRASDRPRAQVEELAPLIADLLDDAGLKPSDLAAVAAGTGPATYTGLRIGLATARTLGLVLGVPVWGVNTLDALAAEAAIGLSVPPGIRILATGDAKRREVFWALYVTADCAGDPAGLLRLEGPVVGPAAGAPTADLRIGPGAGAYPEVLPLAPGVPMRVDPLTLARVAALRAAAGNVEPAEPVYLRRPDTAEPSARKRVTVGRSGADGEARRKRERGTGSGADPAASHRETP
jgi:tRNA threonylcarbamoyladenosine biosynthesis protein TsaB